MRINTSPSLGRRSPGKILMRPDMIVKEAEFSQRTVVVPGAVLLFFSGIWLIVEQFGGWNFINIPWLAGMVFLFMFEFIEGNTVTRLYFMRLRRLTNEALKTGDFTCELEHARAESTPTFTHFLDLPMLFLIIALGAIKPDTWTLFIIGAAVSILIAFTLTIYIPKLYPVGKRLK